jgi:F-type H+-transporting ATPase subunit delta
MPASRNAQPDAVARVYASSLFEIAEAKGGREAIEETQSELEEILELSRRDRSFGEFLASQILSHEDRKRSLEAIFRGRASDRVVDFLKVLSDKGRLGHLAAIVAAYDELLQRHFGRVEVDVYTASPAEEGLLDSLTSRLRETLGKEPVLHAYVDESMIGGLRLRIGDELVDASVSSRLRKMREGLKTSSAARLRGRVNELFEGEPGESD